MKITLLGDSIRLLGYGTLVPEILGDKFQVFQPDDNCRFSKYTLRGLFDWEEDMRHSRIIHWNNGLWDVCDLFGDGTFTSEEEYVSNMLRIADILQNRCEKVIFATTTPVTNVHPHNKNSTIKRYNDIIVPLLSERGVLINDLYSLVSEDINAYIRKDDNIHLTETGIKVCAQRVAKIIEETAKTL